MNACTLMLTRLKISPRSRRRILRTNSVPTSMIPTILRRKKTATKRWDNGVWVLGLIQSMKHSRYLAALFALLGAIGVALVFSWPYEAKSTEQITPSVPPPTVSHAQSVWISALEWCESQGKPTAVNAKDRDGTPSYYSFQFKPDTFEAMKARYGIEGVIESQETQQAILEAMVLDRSIKNAEWGNSLFPGCVKKLGYPP